MPKSPLMVFLSVAAWLLISCWAQVGGPDSGSPEPSKTRAPEPTVPPGAQEAVAAAKKDLSSRTGKPLEQLVVVSVEEVEWRDSSLGCPEPGKFYAQVITPGYRIVLSDGARQDEYHSDLRGNVVACQGGR